MAREQACCGEDALLLRVAASLTEVDETRRFPALCCCHSDQGRVLTVCARAADGWPLHVLAHILGSYVCVCMLRGGPAAFFCTRLRVALGNVSSSPAYRPLIASGRGTVTCAARSSFHFIFTSCHVFPGSPGWVWGGRSPHPYAPRAACERESESQY